MAKSQETYNKKEKEKKRLKQRQEKQQKKEERKASAGKGKGLDDMLAYVDENGNISSTPPDPMKKKSFKADDIQLGAAKQIAADPNQLRNGTVTFFNESKGYGFIKDQENQDSIFVHINSLEGPVKENDKVTFKTVNGPKGLSATNVRKTK